MAGRQGFPRAVATCQRCGKQCYLTRADAKTVGRTVNPAAHLSPYQCGDYWHFGKLSPTIARGYGTREGSTAYPPSTTRDIDYAAAQRKVRRRAVNRTTNQKKETK